MNQPQFESPDTEGAARASQMVAMSATVIEALARLQASRTVRRAEQDERTAAASRAQRTAEHASARVAWSPAHNDRWLRQASTRDLGVAWSAAATWAPTDPDAAAAVTRVEARLHELHPEAMAAYHQARARGADRGQAMAEAAPHFATPPALTDGGSVRAAASPGHTRSRPPRVVAGDAYPYQTRDGVAAAARGQVHVITTATGRAAQPTARATAHR